MTVLAKRNAGEVARPLKRLVPLIQVELAAAQSAGVEHYRHAGQMLLEAKEQVSAGSWGRWLGKNFALSDRTAREYMLLAKLSQKGAGGAANGFQSKNEVLGKTKQARKRRAAFKPLFAAMSDVDQEAYSREEQAQREEIRLRRELAAELIDLGFRALALRLHPDRGGSNDAMARLSAVHEELKEIATNRRFI